VEIPAGEFVEVLEILFVTPPDEMPETCSVRPK
jgi:hypothetical protein